MSISWGNPMDRIIFFLALVLYFWFNNCTDGLSGPWSSRTSGQRDEKSLLVDGESSFFLYKQNVCVLIIADDFQELVLPC